MLPLANKLIARLEPLAKGQAFGHPHWELKNLKEQVALGYGTRLVHQFENAVKEAYWVLKGIPAQEGWKRLRSATRSEESSLIHGGGHGMRHFPIEYKDAFVLNGRRIADGDKLEFKWPDGQTVTTVVKLIQGELRIVGTIHGIKCWIVLDSGVRRREVLANWPEGDEYG